MRPETARSKFDCDRPKKIERCSALSAWQYRLDATHQQTRPDQEQPIESPQLEHNLEIAIIDHCVAWAIDRFLIRPKDHSWPSSPVPR